MHDSGWSKSGKCASSGNLLQIEFHGIAYSVTTVVQEGENLTVEVEQQSEASRWRGQFTAQCTEEHFEHSAIREFAVVSVVSL